MRISITGRKVNLRDNFKQLAQKKLSRFERIFDEDAEANVVVTVEKNRQTVEITIKQRVRTRQSLTSRFTLPLSTSM